MTQSTHATDAQSASCPIAPAHGKAAEPASTASPSRAPSKLDTLVTFLQQPGGASLAEMVIATGWQAHSLRGAMAGALRKRGHVILSERLDGVRRYCITVPAEGAQE